MKTSDNKLSAFLLQVIAFLILQRIPGEFPVLPCCFCTNFSQRDKRKTRELSYNNRILFRMNYVNNVNYKRSEK